MIVGMLLLDRTDLGAPISSISPWLDMLIRTDDEVFGLLEGQRHRRFIKTHTPLDGLPRLPSVTYITDDPPPPRRRDVRPRSFGQRTLRSAGRAPQPPRWAPKRPPKEPSTMPPRRRMRTCGGSSTTMWSPPVAARTVSPTTATRSSRTGTPVGSPTCICSTTRTCGRIAIARCGGSPPRWTSTWTRTDGRRSSRRPASSRCEPAPATPLLRSVRDLAVARAVLPCRWHAGLGVAPRRPRHRPLRRAAAAAGRGCDRLGAEWTRGAGR